MKKVLIISHDKVGTSMSGPGIRYHYMGKVLSEHFEVTLGFFGPENVPDKAFERPYAAKHIDVHKFQDEFTKADAVIALWLSDAQIEFCNEHNKLVVFDMYAPVPVENLAVKIFSGAKVTEEDDYTFLAQLTDYQRFLQNGDAFLYSNQRQLDYWIGYAFGAGQVSPLTYSKRDLYSQFIPAPFGIDTKEPLTKGTQLYKGVLKGIDTDDVVMVWAGGIYDFYDGLTLVDAMKLVWQKNPRIKLLFPGLKHPSATGPQWQETTKTVARAKASGLVGKNIFFFDSWVPYGEILNFLLEADMGVYTHKPSIETEFSHRTRVVDSYLKAKLPVVATKGDHFADVIEQQDIGRTVPAFDAEALAAAVLDLAEPANYTQAKYNLEQIRPHYDWNATLAPLVTYLSSNPKKIPRILPLQQTAPAPSKTLRYAKRLTPKVVKKAALKVMPTRLKRRLLSHK